MPASQAVVGSSTSGLSSAESVLFVQYEKQRALLPPSLQNQVSCILLSCLNAVALVHEEDLSSSSFFAVNEVEGKQGTVVVPTTGAEATFSSLFGGVGSDASNASSNISGGVDARSDIALVQGDDLFALEAARANCNNSSSSSSSNKGVALEVCAFERRALIRRQLARLLLPLVDNDSSSTDKNSFPLIAEPFKVRGVDETELLTNTQLTAEELHRGNRLREANDMLVQVSTPFPNFTGVQRGQGNEDGSVLKRRFYRHLPAFTLPHILAKESVKDPLVLKRYYPITDQLIYILHWPPPDRRLGKETWSPLNCISASDVTTTTASVAKSKSRPGTSSGATASGIEAGTSNMLTASDCERLRQDTLYITPAGKALAVVRRLESTNEAWLSIYVADCLIGLRYANDGSGKNAGTKSSTSASKIAESKALVGGGEEGEEDARILSEEEKEVTASAEAAGGGEGAMAAPDDSASNSAVESKDGGAEGDVAAEGEGENKPASDEGSAGDGDESEQAKPPTKSAASKVGAKGAPVPVVVPTEKTGNFFVHTEDGVRIVACKGPNPQPCLKPDKFGFVCMMVTVPSGLTTTVCTDGTVRFSSVIPNLIHPSGSTDPLGQEESRFVCRGGTVVRNLSGNGPYCKDIMSHNGTRTLINRNASSSSSSRPARSLKGFHAALLADAPEGWRYVRFTAQGTCEFFLCEPGTEPEGPGIKSASMSNISTQSIDAQTKAKVIAFKDGRVLVLHRDGVRESIFPDGTKFLAAGPPSKPACAVLITKSSLPPIEVDLEVDSMCALHSQGKKVPIAKGGERVRVRVGMSDGSALMIKYDTRITSKTNGSLKIVRRDKTVVSVFDDGQVTFATRASWGPSAAATFAYECEDCYTYTPLMLNLSNTSIMINNRHGSSKSLAMTSSVLSNAGGVGGEGRSRVGGGKGEKGMVENTSQVTFALDTMGGEGNGAGGGATTGAGNDSLVLSTLAKNMSASPTQKSASKGGDGDSDAGSKRGRKNDKGSGRRGGEDGEERSSQSPSRGASPPLPSEEELEAEALNQTVFTFNVLQLTCTITDNEFNKFHIELQDATKALSPTVELAGEVEGLEPTAIADSPIDPRVFIVHRSGEAQEVLSATAIKNTENIASCSPEVSCFRQQQRQQEQQHTFFARKKVGEGEDTFTFADIYTARVWQNISSPATASLVVHTHTKTQSNQGGGVGDGATTALRPRVFEVLNVVERQAISDDVYAQIADCLEKWKAFKVFRVGSMDRFAVGETRSDAEIEQEEKLRIRLKQAYKQVKAAEKKKKEKEREERKHAQMHNPQTIVGGGGVVMSKLELGGIDEEEEEGGEGEMDEDEGSEGGEGGGGGAGFSFDKQKDMLDNEISDAFEDFCAPSTSSSAAPSCLPFSSLRSALIQILNCALSKELLEQVLRQNNLFSTNTAVQVFTRGEFRRIFLGIKEEMDKQKALMEGARNLGLYADNNQLPLPPASPFSLSDNAADAYFGASLDEQQSGGGDLRAQTGPGRLQSKVRMAVSASASSTTKAHLRELDSPHKSKFFKEQGRLNTAPGHQQKQLVSNSVGGDNYYDEDEPPVGVVRQSSAPRGAAINAARSKLE